MRELVLEAPDEQAGVRGDLVGEPRLPEPLPDVAGTAPMDGGLSLETDVHIG